MILAAAVSCREEEPDFGPANIGVGTESLTFTKDGGEETISLYANRDWTAELTSSDGTPDWLSLSSTSGSAANDSVYITVSALPNTGEDRYATINFNTGTLTASVSVTQPGELARQYTPISDVRALYNNENVTITEDWTICGIVISNYRHAKSGGLNNATSQKTVIVQDETAGISLYLEENNTEFALGDRVEIKVNGLELQRYQEGSLQLNAVPLANVTKLTSGSQVEPVSISAADLLTGEYESQYVAVEDVQVMDSDLGKTFVTSDSDGEKRHTSINFISRTGQRFVLFSSSYSTFGDELVPEGSGTLKGIAAVHGGSTYQISITSTDDYAGLTGERFDTSEIPTEGKMIGDYNTWNGVGPLDSFFDDFSSVTSGNQEYINDNWLFWTNDGSSIHYGFKTGTFNDDADKYIQIAPYSSTAEAVIAYALPPRADMANANPKTFTFSKAMYYQNADDTKMEVVVSTDFAGDFETATWTVVKDVTFPSGSDMNVWTDETVDLSSYSSSSSLCIALRYTGKSITYRIDNVGYGDTENADGPDEPDVPGDLTEVTIQEFMEAEVGDGVWYQLTGEVFDIYNTDYGNFWIKDEDGNELTVYGLTKTKQETNDHSFESIGLEEGDIVTIASLRAEFNGEAQAGGTPPAYYISHESGQGTDPDPDDPTVTKATVADILAAEPDDNVWYQVTGTITNLENTAYGNFDLVDETGTIYVYGLTAKKVSSNDQSFSSLGLKEGDIVTLIGTRDEYYGDPQIGGPAYYVSHIPGESEPSDAISGTAGNGDYAGNVDLSQPSANTSDEKWQANEFIIDGSTYTGMKLGTSDVAGSYSFKLGKTGSRSLSMYAIAWNNKKTNALVKISGGGTINGKSEVELNCQTNTGLAGNGPFTITFGPNDYYTLSIEGATANTVITVTTEGMSNSRVAFLGVSVD